MPVYLFQGEEGYYIDQLTDLLMESVVDEGARDFNQTLFYGLETEVATIINACKRYPMMSEKQLVVVKEAQGLKNIDDLIHYVKKPLTSTVLVICYKHGKLDGRKKLSGEIDKTGIVFESKKAYENKMPDFIISYLKGKQVGIDLQTAQVLTNYLGNDLSRVINELDKLLIALPPNQKRITAELIEQNTGISKDFNNFELQKAVALRDRVKAQRIALYFEQNQKNNPYVVTLATLFGFFANLMICQYAPDQSKAHLMQVLGFKWDMQIADYLEAMKNYKPIKTLKNVALIREYDAKGKGVGNSSVPPAQLLIELLYKLMH